jgi:hypothetical protein
VQQSIFLSTNYHFNKGNGVFLGSIRYLLQKRNDYVKDQSDVQRDFIFEPSLCFLSHFDPSLNASMGYVQLNNLKPLISKSLVNNRVITATHLRLNYKRQLYSLDYTRNDCLINLNLWLMLISKS